MSHGNVPAGSLKGVALLAVAGLLAGVQTEAWAQLPVREPRVERGAQPTPRVERRAPTPAPAPQARPPSPGADDGPRMRPGGQPHARPGDHTHRPGHHPRPGHDSRPGYHPRPHHYPRPGYSYRRPGYIIVAPPLGYGVRTLPPYSSTYWHGGVPYYYSDRSYYTWQPSRSEYVVTEAPPNAPRVDTRPAPPEDIFVYPKEGQSVPQLATDRYECHRWAVGQTEYDPTEPLGGVTAAEVDRERAAYRRAESACLEGRGYTVG